MSDNVKCIICGTENLPNARFCQQCGGQMKSLQETVLVPDAGDDPSVQILQRNSYFGPKAVLSFYVRELGKSIASNFEQNMTVGRDTTVLENHLDLSNINAAKYGVSRQHVRLFRSGSTILVEDLDTKNGTYLNGAKLPAKRPEVLSHGDELRLAKLKLTVVFRQE